MKVPSASSLLTQNAYNQKYFVVHTFFSILKYLHVHNEIPWEWNIICNMKFIQISHISFTYDLKVIYNTFMHEAKCVCLDPLFSQSVLPGRHSTCFCIWSVLHFWFSEEGWQIGIVLSPKEMEEELRVLTKGDFGSPCVTLQTFLWGKKF